MTKRTKAKQCEMEAACTEVIRALAARSPESEEGRVLTRHGLLSVSCYPCSLYDELNLYCRFLTPGISARRKWNHKLRLDDPVGQALQIFENAWSCEADLAEVEFLAACGQVLEARIRWTWERYIFGPTAKLRHLRVLGQPGAYSARLSVWAQPDTETFAEQDDRAFWAIVREFGAGEAIASRREAVTFRLAQPHPTVSH